jgi:hypothetical protein
VGVRRQVCYKDAQMDPMGKPAMERHRQRRRASETRARELDDDRVGMWRRSWALTRWAVMVVVIGAATGAAITIAITVLLNLLDTNL